MMEQAKEKLFEQSKKKLFSPALLNRHSRNPSLSGNPPTDRYFFIYVLVFLLGVSGHLPWNAILTAQPYFNARLAQSSIGSEFAAHFAIIFKALKLAIFSAVSLAGLKINNKLWVGVSALGNVLVFSLLAAMVKSGSVSANVFYLSTLALVVAAGLFLALYECGMYSILGPFPSRLTQSFLAGNAIGGIMAALNMIVAFYSAKNNIYASTKTYFIVSTLVFLASFGLFIVFVCTDYFKYYQRRLALYSVVSQATSPREYLKQTLIAKDGSEEALIINKRGSYKNLLDGQTQDLIRRLWSPNLALFFIGFVNLAIFPALVSVTESMKASSPTASPFQRELFVPLAFLLLSVADFVGKMLPSLTLFRLEGLSFTMLSLARFSFIPLFLLGNIKLHGHSLIFPSILASDGLFFMLIIAAFLSAAYLATLIMISAPKRVEVSEQSRATVLLCSALQLGVFGGAIFSLFLKLTLRLFVR